MNVSMFRGTTYILVVVVFPALFAWYVLPKLVHRDGVRWVGLPRGWKIEGTDSV